MRNNIKHNILKTGKLLFPVFLFLASFNNSFAQRHEIGFGLGAMNYMGEVAPRFDFLAFRPAGQIFYRYNFNPAIALKFGVSLGQIYANEKNSSDPIAQVRQSSFSSTVGEVALMAEYNFFDYRHPKSPLKFSPYLTGGVAVFNTYSQYHGPKDNTDDALAQIAIPMGVGVKYAVSKQLNLGAEVIARKTFTDTFDGLSKAYIGKQQTGNTTDNDWYFYTGFTLSYTFYGVNCPQSFKY